MFALIGRPSCIRPSYLGRCDFGGQSPMSTLPGLPDDSFPNNRFSACIFVYDIYHCIRRYPRQKADRLGFSFVARFAATLAGSCRRRPGIYSSRVHRLIYRHSIVGSGWIDVGFSFPLLLTAWRLVCMAKTGETSCCWERGMLAARCILSFIVFVSKSLYG